MTKVNPSVKTRNKWNFIKEGAMTIESEFDKRDHIIPNVGQLRLSWLNTVWFFRSFTYTACGDYLEEMEKNSQWELSKWEQVQFTGEYNRNHFNHWLKILISNSLS